MRKQRSDATSCWRRRPCRRIVPPRHRRSGRNARLAVRRRFALWHGADNIARVVADALQAVLGQPVVIENRVGRTGTSPPGAVPALPQMAIPCWMGSGTCMARSPCCATCRTIQSPISFPSRGWRTITQVLSVRADHPARDLGGFLALAAEAPKPVQWGQDPRAISTRRRPCCAIWASRTRWSPTAAAAGADGSDRRPLPLHVRRSFGRHRRHPRRADPAACHQQPPPQPAFARRAHAGYGGARLSRNLVRRHLPAARRRRWWNGWPPRWRP